jgi:hypothetical protein
MLVNDVLCLPAYMRRELLMVANRTVKAYPLFVEITTVIQFAVLNFRTSEQLLHYGYLSAVTYLFANKYTLLFIQYHLCLCGSV